MQDIVENDSEQEKAIQDSTHWGKNSKNQWK